MCGIFGILSKNTDVRKYIIDGLIQLQNRGYDSCGIGLNNEEKKFIVEKYASTNVCNSIDILKKAIENSGKCGDNRDIYNIGIGHNRWATHGPKTDINAHPHISNDRKFLLVHNGIIENYSSIKQRLSGLKCEGEDINFYSQTDSEVVVALISYYYSITNDTLLSIEKAISDCRGTYGLVIMKYDEPNKLYCVRNGSPLLVGVNDEMCIVTSEQSGFCNLMNTYITLNNDDICCIQLDNNNNNNSIIVNTNHIYSKNKVINKGRALTPAPYKHWTLKEINEQPDVILNSINRGGRIKDELNVKLGGLDGSRDLLHDIDNIIILGCGSSFNAGLYGSYFMKKISGFNCVMVIDGADLNEYDIPKIGKTGFILISQSGETKDLHRCIRIAKKTSIVTIGVINVVDSLIAREVDCGIYCNSGVEVGVASTKSFTSQVICLSLIALWFSQIRNINQNIRRNMIKDLRNLSNDYKNTINVMEKNGYIKQLAQTLKKYQNIFILGKECDLYIAREGALKIKEISYIHTESYSSSSLKHGPFALLDEHFPVILLDCVDEYRSKVENCYQEISSRNAPIYTITNNQNSIYNNEKNDVDARKNNIYVIDNKTYGSLLSVIPLQLLAYYISTEKGINPDTPKNLAKVVTVE